MHSITFDDIVSINIAPGKSMRTTVSYFPIQAEKEWIVAHYHPTGFSGPGYEIVNGSFHNHGFIDLVNAMYLDPDGMTLPLDYDSKEDHIIVSIRQDKELIVFKNGEIMSARDLNYNFNILKFALLKIYHKI